MLGLPQPGRTRSVVRVSPANRRVTDGARTRDLRDHNPKQYVLVCPSLLANLTYLRQLRHFVPTPFSVLFGSVLVLLLPAKLEGLLSSICHPTSPDLNLIEEALGQQWRAN